jgi:hypothetical protein
VAEENDCKWVIYQKIDHSYGVTGAYMGAKYSIRNDEGEPVTMNRAVFDAVKPLLLYQDYIEDFREWDGEQVDFNLDLIRENPTTLPAGCINRWPFYIWPDMATDLSKEWLRVPFSSHPYLKNKIIINRTERYNNVFISYNFLSRYKDAVLFIGLDDEYKIFCKQNKLDIPRLPAKDYHEIAMALDNCRLFVGGQSSIFQVAEGLKVTRLLEVCRDIPNVIGSGPGFYDFLTQKSLEYYVNKLYNQ